MPQIYTFKVTNTEYDKTLERDICVVAFKNLAELGYAILATLDIHTYPLFRIIHNGISYGLPSEERLRNFFCNNLFDVTFLDLQLNLGDCLEMFYEEACNPVFRIIMTDSHAVDLNACEEYPKVLCEKMGECDDLAFKKNFQKIAEHYSIFKQYELDESDIFF